MQQKPSLNDPNEFPGDEVLADYLGPAKKAWDAFMTMLKEEYPSFSGEWRYYNDGKSWLYKLTKKKDTICWVSVWEKFFKTGFYFGDKAEDLITNSGLPEEYIDQYLNGQKFGKIRAVTVDVKKPKDLEVTKILMGIKEKLK
ncbi:MAG TPA: DUF3788 family protein [bacterium]|nr:DUF3788 family protein [bacterium]HPN41998.1 DUF3788 family protein [bacterium]